MRSKKLSENYVNEFWIVHQTPFDNIFFDNCISCSTSTDNPVKEKEKETRKCTVYFLVYMQNLLTVLKVISASGQIDNPS